MVVAAVGGLAISFKQRYRCLVLAQQKMTLSLGKQQLVVTLCVSAMTESGKTVLIGAVLEEEVPCVLMYLLIFRGEGDVSL